MAFRVNFFAAAALALLICHVVVNADDDDDEDIDDSDFADTPLLTSLWEATSSGNNDALDRLLDSSTTALSSRSADGRGLGWWAWEFENAYALGSIIANGGDIESKAKDVGGEAAMAMCEKKPECDKDALLKKAKDMVEEIKEKKAAREKEKADLEAETDIDDSEIDDDEF